MAANSSAESTFRSQLSGEILLDQQLLLKLIVLLWQVFDGHKAGTMTLQQIQTLEAVPGIISQQ